MEVNLVENFLSNDVVDAAQEEHKKKRGKYFKTYNEETLTKAVSDVKSNKMRAYAASKLYSVPYTTLVDRMSGKSSDLHGRALVLSPEIESQLAQWLIECAKMGDPRTKEELLQAAAELAKLSPDEKKQFKHEIPSSTWIKGFLTRNKEISFRTPASLTRAAANVSAAEITKFITDFYHFLDEKNFLHLLDDPSAWGNSDETGVDFNPVPRQVLAEKGAKNVYRVETAKPKERVSVMYTFVASGRMLTPQLILTESTSNVADIAFACGGKFCCKFVGFN
jgi:Tc5 transposase DNA-binding domain